MTDSFVACAPLSVLVILMALSGRTVSLGLFETLAKELPSHNIQSMFKKIIRAGSRNGQILAGDSVYELSDINVIHELIDCCKRFRVYDFSFLKYPQVRKNLLASTPTQAFSFLESLTSVGHFNEELVSSTLASILNRTPLDQITPAEAVRLLSLLARQRIVYRNLSLTLIEQLWNAMKVEERIGSIIAVCNMHLNLPNSVELPDAPSEPSQALDYALALLQNIDSFEIDSRAKIIIRNALEIAARSDLVSKGQNPEVVEKLAVARSACFYKHKQDIYDKFLHINALDYASDIIDVENFSSTII
jgi:hypothetical protein